MILTLFGLGVALLARLPAVRRRARARPAGRAGLIVGLGLLAFALAFVGWTRLNVKITFVFDSIIVDDIYPHPPNWQADLQVHRDALEQELWLRSLLPPALRRPCYSDQKIICRLAKDMETAQTRWFPTSLEQSYLESLGVAAVSALAAGLGAWWFTRPAPQPAE